MENFQQTLTIPHQHPSFEGHFPNFKVLPAVVLIKLLEQQLQAHSNTPIYFSSIRKMKFLDMLKPGDKVTVSWSFKNGKAKAIVSNNINKVADGSFTISHEPLHSAPSTPNAA